MARTLAEAQLTTRAARNKLETGVHWRGVDPDVHLGYRRGTRGGRWLVRWRTGAAYQQETLATADDALDADGVATLNFMQAVNVARSFVGRARAAKIQESAAPVPTVRSAVEKYILEREERERAQREGEGWLKRDSRSRLTRHVLSANLAEKALDALTEQDLRSWMANLSDGLVPSTKRRLASDLRAALNAGARRDRAQLPAGLEREIRAGLAGGEAASPSARPLQVLPDDGVRAVIKAAWRVDKTGDWDGCLGLLIVVLAATGARFSQIIRMTVADVQFEKSRVLVPTSRKGRGSKATIKTAIPVGADVLSALRGATQARSGNETLLLRPRWKQLAPTQWTKTGVERWRTASELSRPWKAILSEAGLTAEIVPYCLRHSSIVRGLRVGLPTRLVAATHDTSSAMIEKHYSAHIVSALESLSARSIISLSETLVGDIP